MDVACGRGLFELGKAEYLKDVRETGRGDPAVLALAEGLLDPREMAAFREEVENAEAHNAAREAYAFLPEKEIAKDLRRPLARPWQRRDFIGKTQFQ